MMNLQVMWMPQIISIVKCSDIGFMLVRVDVACDEYHWVINSDDEYMKSDENNQWYVNLVIIKSKMKSPASVDECIIRVII